MARNRLPWIGCKVCLGLVILRVLMTFAARDRIVSASSGVFPDAITLPNVKEIETPSVPAGEAAPSEPDSAPAPSASNAVLDHATGETP